MVLVSHPDNVKMGGGVFGIESKVAAHERSCSTRTVASSVELRCEFHRIFTLLFVSYKQSFHVEVRPGPLALGPARDSGSSRAVPPPQGESKAIMICKARCAEFPIRKGEKRQQGASGLCLNSSRLSRKPPCITSRGRCATPLEHRAHRRWQTSLA